VPREAVLPLHAEPAVLAAGGDNDGAGLVDAVVGGDALDLTDQLQAGDVLVADLGAQALGLLLHPAHELRALDPLDEPRVVLHLGGAHEGAAGGDRAGQHQGVQPGAGGVDRGRVAGRAGADDDDVVDHDSPEGAQVLTACPASRARQDMDTTSGR
jgi:ABC-type sugar transport system, ATPase component